MPDRHENHDLRDIDEYAVNCTRDPDEWKDLPEFDEKKHLELLKDRYNFSDSSSSCQVKNILGLIYGGFTSRFWIYRKHLSMLDHDFVKRDTHKKQFR